MRDSYGGTLLISLMMVFIVIIVCFTAVIVNISKTFRVKNQVINYVEQLEYNESNPDVAVTAINTYLDNSGYQQVSKQSSCNGKWYNRGYCITSEGDYYKVTVYVSVSLPFFGVNLTLPVSGESRAPVNLN